LRLPTVTLLYDDGQTPKGRREVDTMFLAKLQDWLTHRIDLLAAGWLLRVCPSYLSASDRLAIRRVAFLLKDEF